MESNKFISLQLQFLTRIKTILGPDKSMVFELSELLGISTDSVYRRMRGETWLTTEEIVILCQHFHLNFDIVSENLSGSTNFQYSLMKDVDGYIAHWVSMLNVLKEIASAKEKQIIYAAVDIPVFYHFNFPELASFKLFYWMREVVNEPMLKDSVFELDWVYPHLIEQSKEIYTTYCQIPTIEIWSESTVNSLLKQIQYYWEMGLFSTQELALKIIEQSIAELELISKQAEKSCKYEKIDFSLYKCDIEIGNNSVYVKKENAQAVYMGILTFNNMVTYNEAFCQETRTWLHNLMRKSTLISGIAQKQRYQFFREMIKKFEELRERF